ncbi:MAG: transposase [Vulcanimicrobiaceae bacterium]
MEDKRTQPNDEVRRGRPGRRSTKERTEAVLALIAGKRSVDVLSKQFGVSPTTIESWRTSALEGIELAMRRGSEPSRRERELQREVESLKEALTDTSIQLALIKQAIKNRERHHPSQPPRSSR